MSIQLIPLNLLTIAPENVRKTDVGPDDTLVASIRTKGLLQNLVVRPNVAPTGKKKGQPAGTFAVVAGGRRLQALQLLAEEGHLRADVPVPCAVHLEDAVSLSLAENFARKAMAPLDELDAFTTLVDEGRGEEEVARQFGVSVVHVRQRLKLARVSPVIREAFRAGKITLDALKAYTLTDDFAAQEAVWATGWGNSAYSVRNHLVGGKLTVGSKLVRFVGLPTYEAAGGAVSRDLFGEAPACIEDPALISRLAMEKLQARADALLADGWAWIVPVEDLDYTVRRGCRKLSPSGSGLTDEEEIEAEGLSLELEDLDDDEDAARMAEIQARLAELDGKVEANAWTAEQKETAGGWVTISYDGTLTTELGYVRPEMTDEEGTGAETEGAIGLMESFQVAKDEPAATGHSWALVEDMSAHLTAGLQAELVERPDLAYLVLLHSMVLDLFFPSSPDRSVNIRASYQRAEFHGSTVKDSPAVQHINARHGNLALCLPKEPADLWTYLVDAAEGRRAEILAVCVACSVIAIQKAGDRGDILRVARGRLGSARRLAAVVGLDMARWWRPTAASYLGNVSKEIVIGALTEAGQVKPGEKLAGAKKADLVALAQERLGPTTWLPAFLRIEAPAEGAASNSGTLDEPRGGGMT